MQLLKQLGTLIEQATNDANTEPPLQIYERILDIINSRVDMPKHTINGVSKRLSIKNKKVLFLCFDLLEYLSYRCELALYSQVSSKEFLLKISGLLMAQDIDASVQTKVLQTIRCWEELFRPHEDLLPMFFQFYAGLLRKEFPIQNGYVSPYRPKDFKIYKKSEPKKQEEQKKQSKPAVQPTKGEQKTFEQIREKLILTNEIIDNANPAEGVKSNELLLEMMEDIKACEKRINQTINQNPNEKIMELALAVNDDICITYRRFKDLQKSRKPEPFILAELASDIEKEKYQPKPQKVEKTAQKPAQPNKPKDIFDDFQEKPRPKQQSKKQIDIFDIACEPKKPAVTANTGLMDLTLEPSVPIKQQTGSNIFDLLGNSQSTESSNVLQNNNYASNSLGYPQQMNPYPTNSSINFTGAPISNPYQSNNFANISLGNSFQTENDLNKYDDKNIIIQKLTDLTDFSDFMKK